MKKILMIVTLCVVLILTSMPVFAAYGAIDPADYITAVVVDGDTKKVTYTFDGIAPYLIDTRNNSTYYQGVVSDTYQVGLDSTMLSAGLRFYAMGKKFYSGQAIYNGSAIDISDILPGATLDISFGFVTYFDNLTDPARATVSYRGTAVCYDSAGKYLRAVESERTSSGLSDDITSPKGILLNLSVSPDVAYIALYSTYTVSVPHGGALIDVEPQPVTMTVPVNMIAEQSNMMQTVIDKMGDIDNNLDGVNDKLDHIGGVLDSTVDFDSSISDFGNVAGDAGNAMNEAGEVISDAGNMIGGMMSNNVMVNCLTGVSQLARLMFSDDYQIRICGLTINPFEAWVVIGGGLALVGLIMAYIFRKRGGGGSGA